MELSYLSRYNTQIRFEKQRIEGREVTSAVSSGHLSPASVFARSLCVGPDRRQILFLFRIRKGSVLGCIVFMATERQAPGLGVARHTCLVWIQVSEVAILQLSSTQRQPRHSVLR